MRHAALLLALLSLSACTWETYQDQHGKTGLRQRYAPGTPVVYQDGTFARDQRYNEHRPVPVPLTREQHRHNVPRTTWSNENAPDAPSAVPGEQPVHPIR